jgi:hypothetical protein
MEFDWTLMYITLSRITKKIMSPALMYYEFI